jgi:hypothetical protein
MKAIRREVFFAILAWLVPFVASVCLFGLKSSYPPLFDTLMGVVLTASTALLGIIYLRRTHGDYVATGFRIGVMWTVANWLLDGVMFSSGPMKMSLSQYASDIGIAYLAIPALTIGLGLAAANASAHDGSLPTAQ